MISTATKENANDIKNDIKSAYHNTKHDLKDTVYSMSNRLSEAAEKAGHTAREYFDTASEQVTGVAKKLNREIHTNPVRSTLIAVTIGYILGAFFRR